jgi:hypothetical protein
MKAIRIENGMQITEGQLPDGMYYLCAKYSDFDQINGTLVEVQSDRPDLIKLISTEDPENYLAFPEDDREMGLEYPMVSCQDNVVTYTGQYWPAPQQHDHCNTETEEFDLGIDDFDAEEFVLAEFPIII